MALAYTPGLKRKENSVVRKSRILPLPGEVLVNKGDEVTPTTIVAKCYAPGNARIFNVAEGLDLARIYAGGGEGGGGEGGGGGIADFGAIGETGAAGSAEVKKYMLFKEGDRVEKGQIIAHYRAWFGLIKRDFRSPYTGTLENIDDVSGQVILRDPSIPLELNAHIPGIVTEVIEGNGAVVEITGTYIQGIFGIGGETRGEIKVLSKSPDEVLTAGEINPSCAGKVLVGGSLVEGEALHKAVEVGAKGIVIGGVEDKDLTSFLGYSIGVAITGGEAVDLTLIVTEGFGKIGMAKRTFDLLKKCEGKLACIDGSTQIRAGVVRPEIVIPHSIDLSEVRGIDDAELLTKGMVSGLPVRIIRSPYFGKLGYISRLIVGQQKLETESDARVLEVELLDGRKVVVPRANVELIEE